MKNLNFSSVPSREPLPEGMYILTVIKAEEVVSQSKKDMIKVQFQEIETKTTIFDNFVIQENTMWKLKEFLGALGYDVQGELAFDVTEIDGLMVKAKVFQEEYNGSPQNRIKKYYNA